MEEGTSRGPGVRIPPPLLFLLPLAAGLLVQHFVPIRIVKGEGPSRILWFVGIAEIVISVMLMAWAMSTFKRLQTPIIPVHPARTLAEEGPYTLTRNPMYLALTVIFLGVSFVANAFWPVLFLPGAIVLTYLFAIKREEAYLTREFSDAYVAYCARVRRWI